MRVTIYSTDGHARRIADALAESVAPLRFEVTDLDTRGSLLRVPHGGFRDVQVATLTSVMAEAAPGPVHVTFCDSDLPEQPRNPERCVLIHDNVDTFRIRGRGGDGFRRDAAQQRTGAFPPPTSRFASRRQTVAS